jgi:predicted amidophosphoribosyltransferase
MIECEEKNEETPICPHCETPLTKIFCRRLASVFGKRYVYFCSHCKKVLGISHRKGFWMG